MNENPKMTEVKNGDYWYDFGDGVYSVQVHIGRPCSARIFRHSESRQCAVETTAAMVPLHVANGAMWACFDAVLRDANGESNWTGAEA